MCLCFKCYGLNTMRDLSLLVCVRTATGGGVVSPVVARGMMGWSQLSICACPDSGQQSWHGLNWTQLNDQEQAACCRRGLSCLSVFKAWKQNPPPQLQPPQQWSIKYCVCLFIINKLFRGVTTSNSRLSVLTVCDATTTEGAHFGLNQFRLFCDEPEILTQRNFISSITGTKFVIFQLRLY